MKRKEKFYTEEQKEIFSFLKILGILVVIVVIFYFLTSKVFNNKSLYTRTNKEGAVQYNYIYLGTLLNLSDSEYYVLALDINDASLTKVLNAASLYKSKEKNALPLYYSDLNFELNKNFVSNESSYDEKDLAKLKINKLALIKVSNGKITKFVTSEDEIASLLK